jgi:hypothetical protein
MRVLRQRRLLLASWIATRILFVAIVGRWIHVPGLKASNGDVRLYGRWARILAGGHYPVHDPQWQYPPLAGPLMLLPKAISATGLTYFQAFLLLAVVADGIVLAVLALHRHGRFAGAWTWVAWPFLLGPMGFARYDLFVTLAAVLALVALPRMRWFGVLVGAGAMLKVWPALFLLALPQRREAFQAIATFAGTVVVCFAGGFLVGGHQLSFLTGQSDRGIEQEALAATPFHILRAFGWTGVTTRYQYGSQEFVGAGVQLAAKLSLLATVVALVVIAWMVFRRRAADWDPAYACDVALVVTLASIVTSRVLSPQYFIWLVGVGAVCLVHAGTRQRLTVGLVLAATALSHWEYPYHWDALKVSAPDAVALLSARNLLLLIALGTGLWALRRGPAPVAEGSPDHEEITPATL